jgi:two-component system, chemotaxis family, protein-glutamate methylesterase/glutaminase
MSATDAPVLRVLICDDSLTYAAALARLLQRDPAIEVVEVCGTAEAAIARLSRISPRPDLVTMDLELPGMSGGEAIEQIMSAQPVPILALAGGVQPGSQTALAALAAGALDAVPKEGLDLLNPDSPRSRDFRRRVKVLSRIPVIRHPRAGLIDAWQAAEAWGGTASIIGVAASAGGPQALAEVFAEIPAEFPIPILVVQHIVDGFGAGFARWLGGEVPLAVRVAADGEVPRPGLWIAPDGAHLTLGPAGRLRLDRYTDAGFHRPSGDVLLRSLAEHAGNQAVAVVLTGMGRDGADGLREVRRARGLTIAQDEATSAVFGMPQAAIERGAELILGAREIGRRLRALRLFARAS